MSYGSRPDAGLKITQSSYTWPRSPSHAVNIRSAGYAPSSRGRCKWLSPNTSWPHPRSDTVSHAVSHHITPYHNTHPKWARISLHLHVVSNNRRNPVVSNANKVWHGSQRGTTYQHMLHLLVSVLFSRCRLQSSGRPLSQLCISNIDMAGNVSEAYVIEIKGHWNSSQTWTHFMQKGETWIIFDILFQLWNH